MTAQSNAVSIPRPSKFGGKPIEERLWRAFIWALLVAGAAAMILPFLWLLTSSLKTQLAVFRYPPQWIPIPPRFQNYVEAWTTRPFGVYLRNTFMILVLNEIAIVGTSALCAYGFARIEFPGKNFWFGVVLSTMMLPGIVLMIPTFVIFSRLHWVNTYYPLIIPAFFGGGAFNIFLLRQFFRTLPEELTDAARIDGCSEFGIFWRIMMPLAKPALATVAVFTFIGTWNDYMGPLLYLSKDPNKYTVALGLATFRSAFLGRTRWDLLMAASTMMIMPIIIIYFLAQRYFIQGIAVSGLKG
ncbi:MAG TPA: carbohydrate ABC transporter permease [Anaerolineae bacterium]|nr:carbohydrate ABC transporter permease [Anaerolineae bacterium]HQI84059.1 carbohydrate ABC transporter permease [Anaerolineae bacterium]